MLGTDEGEETPVDDGTGYGWFHDSRVGRLTLTGVIAFLVYALVVWNLPASSVRSDLRPGVDRVVQTMAIYQQWSVFAPNPTTVSIAVEADIHMASGEVIRHTFPDGDPLFGAYREYRWRKWERRIRLDRYDHLWRHTAQWLADRYADEGTVETVVLIRHFSDTPEPGRDDERVWNTFEFYEYDVPPEEAG
ncbi:MAG: hypothetical protein R8F63_18025 [Acidimicrobiales bacterium]|nr:hypothetical protein [Acidimicrobiales bacterium]